MKIACPLLKLSPRCALALLTTVIVVAAVVTGLIVSNSPAQERARKLDQRRSESLSQIRYAVSSYREQSGALPESLDELELDSGPKGGYASALLDPATNEPYEYRRLDENLFELCAVFADVAPDYEYEPYARPIGPPGTTEPDFWRHDPGRQCWTVGAMPVKFEGIMPAEVPMR